MYRTILSAIAALSLGAAAVGCAEPQQTTAVRLPAPDADGRYHPPMEKEMPLPATRLIATEMGPPFEDCGEAQIRFAFDKSVSLPQVDPQLKELAACLNAPARAQTRIGLVGRADPRGDGDYNDELAERRGNYIRARLVELGVAPDRMVVSSRGERESVGARPEYSYGYDRRVDVVYLRAILPSHTSLPEGAPNVVKTYHGAPAPAGN